MGCHHTHANFHPARNFKKGVYWLLWLCMMAVLNNAMFDETCTRNLHTSQVLFRSGESHFLHAASTNHTELQPNRGAIHRAPTTNVHLFARRQANH